MCGFHAPSPVQRAAIPLGRLGADLVVQAKSGTGKTVTFGVVVLDRVSGTLRHPQALIVAPTREVALQSHATVSKLAAAAAATTKMVNAHTTKTTKTKTTTTLPDAAKLEVHVCLGGLPVAGDRAALTRGAQVLIGTPGRLKQLLQEGSLRPDGVRTFVVDEADALMGGSFEEDVLFIHGMLPTRKQVLAFSATYPPEMRRRRGLLRFSPFNLFGLAQ